MEKLLAALSLASVGDIKALELDSATVTADASERQGLFCLQLKSRAYVLRAKDDDERVLWVDTLQGLRLQSQAHGQTQGQGAAGGMNPMLALWDRKIASAALVVIVLVVFGRTLMALFPETLKRQPRAGPPPSHGYGI